MTRTFFVGGNFKMNGSKSQIASIVDGLNDAKLNPEVEVVICPPAPYLAQAIAENKQKTVAIGAQNVYLKESGAYTGEICPSMLKDLGAEWTLTGHSERRALLGESSQFIAEKTKYAIDSGVSVIFCCGEQKEDRESGKTFAVVSEQITPVVRALAKEDWSKLVIAYEPVWAIGTGLTATPEDAEATHKEIREFVAKEVGQDVADAVRILYGGSVNAKTAPELSKKANIDGFLVGGASLKPEFIDIINV